VLLDAAESILEIFGFDMPLYGKDKDKDKRWWIERKRNRTQDIQTEATG